VAFAATAPATAPTDAPATAKAPTTALLNTVVQGVESAAMSFAKKEDTSHAEDGAEFGADVTRWCAFDARPSRDEPHIEHTELTCRFTHSHDTQLHGGWTTNGRWPMVAISNRLFFRAKFAKASSARMLAFSVPPNHDDVGRRGVRGNAA
tara:strand:- start:824 stop:1273 length:450 start_codon:yes stop_codon:yes gene_type:complete